MEIPGFELFVTTTGDSWLEHAINQIRFNIIQRNSTVPEPTSLALLGLGIMMMLWVTARRRRVRA